MKSRDHRRLYGAIPAILAACFFIYIVFADNGLDAPATVSLQARPESSSGSAPSNKPGTPGTLPETPVPKIEPLSNRIVDYHISVRLDAERHMLHGEQTVTWRHPGKLPVQELYFHLYPNAFRDDRTTFNRESGGKLRDDERTPDSIGYMEILSITRSDGADLLDTMRYVQPDDDNPADQTLMVIKLPEPVEPGQSVTLNMSFQVQLPYIYARMGYAGDFVMAGQWFPKLAVYEPKGRRGAAQEGWNLHQYHGNSEFYADFGTYNIKIDVPSSHIVAATGFPVAPHKDDGVRRLYHFYAEDVHDFAWAASPDFIYAEEAFSTPHLPGVKIKLYLDPHQAHLEKRYFTAAKRALSSFSEWYGAYPYSTLSIVVPPSGAGGAGGMEYPTLITAWEASEAQPSRELERVVVHEIGHQFWYGIVASNEFEEAWLDEGFTTYVEDKVMESQYGLTRSLPILSSYITDPEPLKLNAWDYDNHEVYAENVYTRASLVLQDIEQTIGTKKMKQVLRTYFQRWKFRHPTTQDFQKVLQDVTHRNWDSYFKQFVYGDMMIDYAVTGVKSRQTEQHGTTVYETRVYLERLGGVHRPVEVAIKLADGSIHMEKWNGAEKQKELVLYTEQPAEWVLVDPEFRQILENRHYNNFMRAEIAASDEVRWSYGTSKLVELLFSIFAW